VRVPVLVYLLLYLVVEMIGAQLAAVRWATLTPLMVAAAVVDAVLVVAVLVAALVAADLTRHRWRPVVHSWLHHHGLAHSDWWGAHRHVHDGHPAADPVAGPVVGVRSWRPEPLALPAGSSAAAPTASYAAPTYTVGGTPPRPTRPFPDDDGRLL
jgi:hypothetical protein